MSGPELKSRIMMKKANNWYPANFICEIACVPCDLKEFITQSYVILLILAETSLSKKNQYNWIIGSCDYRIANEFW